MTKPPHCGLRMSFGRYKGRQIIRVPDYYLLYLLGKGILGGKYLAHCQHRFSHISHIKNKINMNKQYFKKGDLVTCATYGKGKVISKSQYDESIKVQFEIGTVLFSHDGRRIGLQCSGSAPRSLHQGHINIQEPVLNSLTQVGDLVWVKHPWVEVWGLIKVAKINEACIVSQNGCIWTSWLSLEEGPIWTETPSMFWEEKVEFAETILELWNKLGFSDPVFIPTEIYWLQYRK